MRAVLTEADLRAVVDQFMEFDEFVFDLETVYTPTAEEAKRYEAVRSVAKDRRSIDDQKWLEIFELAPTDPQRNEIIWIGLAGPGGTQAAIPTGHPKGRQIAPVRRVKKPAHVVYAPDDPRYFTPTGRVSNKAVSVTIPAKFDPPPAQLDIDTVIDITRPLFFSEKRIINHNVKFDLKTIAKYFGGFPTGPYVDTILAQHLLNERLGDYKLESLVRRHYGKSYEKLGSKGVQNFSFDKATTYAIRDCLYTYLLWQRFRRALERHPSLMRFLRYEMEVYEAVMLMEYEGIEVDVDAVAVLRAEKEQKIAEIVDHVIVDYGAPPDFNPNANAQKVQLVFKKHKGPVTKRSEKTNQISVDRESLEAVVEAEAEEPGKYTKAAGAASLLLEYADESKVLGTYLVGLPHRLDRRRRVHPDYLLHGTETSRLSCREPNIQNIPRESNMRSMFLAPKGHTLVIGDYDQIELRFIAYLANDPTMLDLFISGTDVHRGTAALVLNKPFEEVTDEERQHFGKMPNFLLGYGGGAFNLHQKTGIPLDRSERVLKQYYRRFNRIDPWKATVIREAKARAKRDDNGKMIVPPYVETMLGRRRRLPELFYSDKKLRSTAERQAVNTITQGSASETAKIAMVNLMRYRQKTGFPLNLIINVHDELVCTVPSRHEDEGKEVLAEIMREVRIPWTGERPLGDELPLAAKVVLGDRWLK